MRRIIATEAQEQEALITWSEHYYFKLGKDGKAVYRLCDYLMAIPNGGLRPILAALAMKRQGVTPGAPDLFLAFPIGGYAGLWIEMKRRTKEAKLSTLQADFLVRMETRGYACQVCYGWDEARKSILNYLEEYAI